ncbi:hypothetical protein ETB97_002010, partial [Aspergillus alliaceus]
MKLLNILTLLTTTTIALAQDLNTRDTDEATLEARATTICGSGYELSQAIPLPKGTDPKMRLATLYSYIGKDKGCVFLDNNVGASRYMYVNVCQWDKKNCDKDSGSFSQYAGPIYIKNFACAPVTAKMGKSSKDLFIDYKSDYYNGTTTFHLEYLMDNQGDSLCRTFRSEATSFTSKSILAVTKPSPDDDSKNPVRIALKSALTDFDFVNNLASGDESKHLQWQFLSISHETPSRSIHRPYFNLSLTNPTGPPYKITGSSNKTNGGVTSISQNLPSCDNPEETWWGLSFLDRSNYNPGHIPITDPQVSLMFDNQTASFSFEA